MLKPILSICRGRPDAALPTYWTDWNDGPVLGGEHSAVYRGWSGPHVEPRLGEECRLDDHEGCYAFGHVIAKTWHDADFSTAIVVLGWGIEVWVARSFYYYDPPLET